MRSFRLAFGTSVVVLVLAFPPVHAAAKQTKQAKASDQAVGAVYGFGIGGLIPEGGFGDFNDPGYFIQSRSLYVERVFGGRAAAYYGDTAGSNGADGGRVYGFDFDVLVKFGGARTFGYVFAGAGYGTLTYTGAGLLPGSTVRHSSHEWCWTGGIGVTIKRSFYIEASYVSYQTDAETTDFIPIVVGYQF